MSIFNHCDEIGQQSNGVRWKKCKIRLLRRSKSFKVIEVVISQKPVCDFLLVISNILYHTVSELSQPTVQILDTLRFWDPFGGLGTTYDVHLGLIGKHIVDFLLVLIEFFR